MIDDAKSAKLASMLTEQLRRGVAFTIDKCQANESTQVNRVAEETLHGMATLIHVKNTSIKYEGLVLVLAGAYAAMYERFILSLPDDQRAIAEEAKRQTLERTKATRTLPVDASVAGPT